MCDVWWNFMKKFQLLTIPISKTISESLLTIGTNLKVYQKMSNPEMMIIPSPVIGSHVNLSERVQKSLYCFPLSVMGRRRL